MEDIQRIIALRSHRTQTGKQHFLCRRHDFYRQRTLFECGIEKKRRFKFTHIVRCITLRIIGPAEKREKFKPAVGSAFIINETCRRNDPAAVDKRQRSTVIQTVFFIEIKSCGIPDFGTFGRGRRQRLLQISADNDCSAPAHQLINGGFRCRRHITAVRKNNSIKVFQL